MTEKSEDEVHFSESKDKGVSGQMGHVRVNAVGMRGFVGFLVFFFFTMALGIPILLVGTMLDRWTSFTCERGAATELDVLLDSLEISFTPVCDSSVPSACVTQQNTTMLSTTEQVEWYDSTSSAMHVK